METDVLALSRTGKHLISPWRKLGLGGTLAPPVFLAFGIWWLGCEAVAVGGGVVIILMVSRGRRGLRGRGWW